MSEAAGVRAEDSELVRELREGIEDLRAGRVVPASDVADDLAARRSAGG